MDTTYLSLAEHAGSLRSREQSALALVDCCIASFDRSEARLNAYKTWNGAQARHVARAVDALFESGLDLGPLMGIPVSVKDLYGVPGMPVFAGSDEALPPACQLAGPVVSRLQRQLGIVV